MTQNQYVFFPFLQLYESVCAHSAQNCRPAAHQSQRHTVLGTDQVCTSRKRHEQMSDRQIDEWSANINNSLTSSPTLPTVVSWQDVHQRRTVKVISGGFRGGRDGSGPPTPLGDGLAPALTVLMIYDNGTVLWRRHRRFIS